MKISRNSAASIFQKFFEAGFQFFVLVSVAASQMGERALRGSKGYLRYQEGA